MFIFNVFLKSHSESKSRKDLVTTAGADGYGDTLLLVPIHPGPRQQHLPWPPETESPAGSQALKRLAAQDLGLRLVVYIHHVTLDTSRNTFGLQSPSL